MQPVKESGTPVCSVGSIFESSGFILFSCMFFIFPSLFFNLQYIFNFKIMYTYYFDKLFKIDNKVLKGKVFLYFFLTWVHSNNMSKLLRLANMNTTTVWCLPDSMIF